MFCNNIENDVTEKKKSAQNVHFTRDNIKTFVQWLLNCKGICKWIVAASHMVKNLFEINQILIACE